MDKFRMGAEAFAALLSDPQGKRLLRMEFRRQDGPKATMLANTLDAVEELSRDFTYTVEVLSNNATISLKAVMGKMVTVSLVRDDGSLRYFNGYVFEFRFVRTDGGFAFYHMVLKPWLAFLRLRQDNAVFQDASIVDLCDKTFQHYLQRDVKYRLPGEQQRLTLAVQYNETDHNHLHRRLEDSGVFYWYEHRQDGHTLWLSDDSTRADPIDGDEPEMVFQSATGSLEDDGVHQWSAMRRIAAGRVTLGSFDFKNIHREPSIFFQRCKSTVATTISKSSKTLAPTVSTMLQAIASPACAQRRSKRATWTSPHKVTIARRSPAAGSSLQGISAAARACASKARQRSRMTGLIDRIWCCAFTIALATITRTAATPYQVAKTIFAACARPYLFRLVGSCTQCPPLFRLLHQYGSPIAKANTISRSTGW
jgi:hypothetical protein